MPPPSSSREALPPPLQAGGVVIVTTFNKTFLSWALGVVVAEHLLGVAEK